MSTAAVLAVLPLFAFDSAKWLAKRGLMRSEADGFRALYAETASRVDSPSSGITVPLESFPDGTVQTLLYAGRAQFFEKTPLIWAENLVLTKLDEARREKFRLEAERCVIDRERRIGWVEGRAKVVQEKTSFEGKNVFFSATNEYVSALSGAVVRADDIRRAAAGSVASRAAGGRAGSDSMRVLAERVDMDRSSGVIMFEGDVAVDYAGEYAMNSDRLFVFVKDTNSLSRVVASGGVAITNGTRCGGCNLAVFRNLERRIEMYGDGNAPASLSDSAKGRNDVAGSRITFWMDAEQVEVIAPVISVEEKQHVR